MSNGFLRATLAPLAARMVVIASIAGAILIALAAWALRDQIYQTFQDPGEPFQTYTPPPAPDYRQASAWFERGDLSDPEMAAVFYVHGTTFPGGSHWNAPLDDVRANTSIETSDLPNFAAPYRSAGTLFIPRYRQAALYAFMNNREDGITARTFAARDVRDAFDAFVSAIGDDRPFIVAGTGQGGLHALNVLMRRVAGDGTLRRRLVAAYLIETTVPLDLFETRLDGITPCAQPEAVRCIVAYASAGPDEDERIRILTERTASWRPNGGLDFVEGRGLLCVNPILGRRVTDYAPARLHRGGVAADGFESGVAPAPLPAQTGAQCVDGILMTEEPRSAALRRPGRLAENYRLPPYNLFYEDLRLDAQARLASWRDIAEREANAVPDLAPPEEIEDAPVRPIPDRAD
ncbi:DUF3089 domain-containing protein [Hyphobacterium marinum]|uniref:DUF3089 domain-containing protein n=1 Tax=Hyphobacterium marinum TaxID=3116574 RepID=A0ABU7LYL0_9PROT|nr:DUF3089 domain-containing protein [Hyphobacterium sp. Y6023]MEE2566632.1 DUF3089 domain-containing protein [Hyphobacterium sp. Y6023]